MKRLTSDAAKIAGIAHGSPAENILVRKNLRAMENNLPRYAKISVVANEVLVIATLIPAAKHKQASCGGNEGNTKHSALPKAAPAAKKGKINPPR